MIEATLTSKHQVTIPQEVREELGLHRGDMITFSREPDGRFFLQRKSPHTSM